MPSSQIEKWETGSAIAEKGCRYTCEVRAKRDLNRQIVKGEQASIRFEELDFEIPSGTQSGQLNTVEGFISKAVEDLAAGQEARKLVDQNVYQKIQGAPFYHTTSEYCLNDG